MSSPLAFSFQARDVILGMTLLESLANGIYTAIFWYTMYLLVFQNKGKRRPRRPMTYVVIVLLYILSIIHLAVRWAVARKAFVVDGATADDVLKSFLGQPTWSIAVSSISFGLMSLIADYVMVWRVWIVWSRDWRATILPFLVVLTGTVFWGFSIALQISPESGLFTSNRNKFAQPAMVYFILSLISAILSTSLIVYRIVSVSRRTGIRMMSPSRRAIEIVVESAALYCMALVVYLPFQVRDDFLNGYPQAVLIAITGIAPTLIAARVSLGVSCEYSTISVQNTFVVASGNTSSSRTVRSSINFEIPRSILSEKEFSPVSEV